MQYVYLNAFDLIAGVFYSKILALNVAFYYTFSVLQRNRNANISLLRDSNIYPPEKYLSSKLE